MRNSRIESQNTTRTRRVSLITSTPSMIPPPPIDTRCLKTHTSSASTSPATPKSARSSTITTPPASPFARSPRNPFNRLWVQEQQRERFLDQLKQWSLSHDSSVYFQGKLSLLAPDPDRKEELLLGKSVSCILEDSTFEHKKRRVVIRLFALPMNTTSAGRRARRFANPPNAEMKGTFKSSGDDKMLQPTPTQQSPSNIYYKLVIRCGSGWTCAREYLNKLYFMHLSASKHTPQHTLSSLRSTPCSQTVDSTACSKKDTVAIQPLFHPFLRLPPELQESILLAATGWTRNYSLCPDLSSHAHLTSLSSILRLSSPINKTMAPYIYHSTTFHFSTTGFTRFLWQAGPTNRSRIRRLTFHFGKTALLHCVRWLAPDPVFTLLEPPVATHPHALQYFWRCQIRDLASELDLSVLTLDLTDVPSDDVEMMVKILKNAFKRVERLRFVRQVQDRNAKGSSAVVDVVDFGDQKWNNTWRELCIAYVERYRHWSSFYYRKNLDMEGEGGLYMRMHQDAAFFDMES